MDETNRKIHELMGKCTVYERTGERRDNCCTPPWYDTDISAAFEAVEWMRKEKGFTVKIDNRHVEVVWYVEVYDGDTRIARNYIESLPAAICEAILAATETP